MGQQDQRHRRHRLGRYSGQLLLRHQPEPVGRLAGARVQGHPRADLFRYGGGGGVVQRQRRGCALPGLLRALAEKGRGGGALAGDCAGIVDGQLWPFPTGLHPARQRRDRFGDRQVSAAPGQPGRRRLHPQWSPGQLLRRPGGGNLFRPPGETDAGQDFRE